MMIRLHVFCSSCVSCIPGMCGCVTTSCVAKRWRTLSPEAKVPASREGSEDAQQCDLSTRRQSAKWRQQRPFPPCCAVELLWALGFRYKMCWKAALDTVSLHYWWSLSESKGRISKSNSPHWLSSYHAMVVALAFLVRYFILYVQLLQIYHLGVFCFVYC